MKIYRLFLKLDFKFRANLASNMLTDKGKNVRSFVRNKRLKVQDRFHRETTCYHSKGDNVLILIVYMILLFGLK